MKGILTNEGLIDSLIEDMNASIRQLVAGNYSSWCAMNTGIVQKLLNLKKGVVDDAKSQENVIEDLKRQLRALGVEVIETKDGVEHGSN